MGVVVESVARWEVPWGCPSRRRWPPPEGPSRGARREHGKMGALPLGKGLGQSGHIVIVAACHGYCYAWTGRPGLGLACLLTFLSSTAVCPRHYYCHGLPHVVL